MNAQLIRLHVRLPCYDLGTLLVTGTTWEKGGEKKKKVTIYIYLVFLDFNTQ